MADIYTPAEMAAAILAIPGGGSVAASDVTYNNSTKGWITAGEYREITGRKYEGD